MAGLTVRCELRPSDVRPCGKNRVAGEKPGKVMRTNLFAPQTVKSKALGIRKTSTRQGNHLFDGEHESRAVCMGIHLPPVGTRRASKDQPINGFEQPCAHQQRLASTRKMIPLVRNNDSQTSDP